jgi:hypothetical protein
MAVTDKVLASTISTGSCWVRVAIWGAALFWAGWYLAAGIAE